MLHSRKLVLVIAIICIIALGSWGGIVLINKTHEVHIQALAERAGVKLEALAKELSPRPLFSIIQRKFTASLSRFEAHGGEQNAKHSI